MRNARAIRDTFDKLLKTRDETLLADVKRTLTTLASTPAPSAAVRAAQAANDDLANGMGPYGSAARTSPGWEREYAVQNWDDETRKIRTPAADVESVELIAAISLNDQAKLREIADRAHNRTYQRADLAIGAGAAGTGGGLVPVGMFLGIRVSKAETDASWFQRLRSSGRGTPEDDINVGGGIVLCPRPSHHALGGVMSAFV